MWVARTLTGLALGFAVAAGATVPLIPDEPFLPCLWPFVYGLAAVLCFGVVAWPRPRWLYMLAGGLSVISWASRPVAVVVRALDGQTVAPRAVLGIVAYSSLAWLSAWYWRTVVAEWRARRTVDLIARGS